MLPVEIQSAGLLMWVTLAISQLERRHIKEWAYFRQWRGPAHQPGVNHDRLDSQSKRRCQQASVTSLRDWRRLLRSPCQWNWPRRFSSCCRLSCLTCSAKAILIAALIVRYPPKLRASSSSASSMSMWVRMELLGRITWDYFSSIYGIFSPVILRFCSTNILHQPP